MTIKFFLPDVSLYGLPFEYKIARIRKAGFDGVEVLASHRNRKRAGRIRALTTSLGLGLHWHQPWSYAENKTHWYNTLAHWFGMLEPSPYKFQAIVPPNRDCHEPIVAYADRFDEAESEENVWFQTCTVLNRFGLHSLPLDIFREWCRETQPPPKVVFDTQHYLEWHFGCTGVGRLPTNPYVLNEALLRGWKDFGPYVAEIHFNDFDPRLGNSNGRNMLLGRGILRLDQFAKAMRNTGWQGTVVLEISPFHLFPYRLKTIRQQLEYAQNLFGL